MILSISVKRYRRTGSVHPVFHFVRTARAALVISRPYALMAKFSQKARSHGHAEEPVSRQSAK